MDARLQIAFNGIVDIVNDLHFRPLLYTKYIVRLTFLFTADRSI